MKEQEHVHLHDSHLAVWLATPEDRRCEAIYRLIRGWLKAWGWKVTKDPRIEQHYKCLSKHHRLATKGDLKAAISLSGRCIEVLLYQDRFNVSNRNGGRYDFDKLERMPYLLRKAAQCTLKKMSERLAKKYGLAVTRTAPNIGPEGVDANSWIDADNRGCCHYREALGRRDWDGNGEYNRKSADGVLLDEGMRVYFLDRKGRWNTGIARYHINSMWWVVTGRYDQRNEPCSDLFTKAPADVRRKCNAELARKALGRRVAQAVKEKRFLDAHKFQTLLDALGARVAEDLEAASLKLAA